MSAVVLCIAKVDVYRLMSCLVIEAALHAVETTNLFSSGVLFVQALDCCAANPALCSVDLSLLV